ncbi:aldo/keto reductase [Bacillus fonticola]|uniref:aldo/keto reductase n=1 Tax=Bacillus fonticola TaxID=2728853 RepID=UPI0014757C08|nr:aldo/keto reductase [Bacillus fonticola]
MDKIRLGKTNFDVSRLGLGCMTIGTEEKTARKILEAALEAGITYFDTADLYDFGKNEEIVGKHLAPHLNDVVIATKVGNHFEQGREGWFWDPSKTYIKEAVKRSCGRLGVDQIQLCQLHGGTIEDPIEETIEAFEELVEEGWILHYGLSSIRPNVIQTYAETSRIASVMVQHSLLDRRPEETVLPLLAEKGISGIARGSVAKGILTNKAPNEWAQKLQENGFLQYSYQELVELTEELKKRFDDKSLLSLALQYTLGQSGISVACVGSSSADQVKETVRTFEAPGLSDDEIQVLQSLTVEQVYEEHRL